MIIKSKIIIYVLVVALIFSLALHGYTLGQVNALEEQNMLLLNLACSLDSAEFKNLLDAMDSTDDFKQLLGEKHEAAWAFHKDRLYATCYN
jgi:hypothetical protein